MESSIFQQLKWRSFTSTWITIRSLNTKSKSLPVACCCTERYSQCIFSAMFPLVRTVLLKLARVQ
jgi:hypothetical protein